MPSSDFDPERMLSALADHEVRFILIGGMAAVLHGDVGVTVDIDVVPERSDENLERLAEALRGLDARLRTEGEPEGLSFDCSAPFFRKSAAGFDREHDHRGRGLGRNLLPKRNLRLRRSPA